MSARKTIVGAVLATDMAHHFSMVTELDLFYEVNEEKLRAGARGRGKAFEPDKQSRFLINVLLHAAGA